MTFEFFDLFEDPALHSNMVLIKSLKNAVLMLKKLTLHSNMVLIKL